MKRYVQVGEKHNNGRIKKAENYTISEFIDKVLPDCPEQVSRKTPSLFDRMFNTNKYKEWLKKEKSIAQDDMYDICRAKLALEINDLIDEDN